MDRLAMEEVTLLSEVAAEHNSTQSRLVMLPNGVRQVLLGMLGAQALGRLAVTSSCWRHSIADPAVWHTAARSAGPKALHALLVRQCARTDAGAELAAICCQCAQKFSTYKKVSFRGLGGLHQIIAAMRSHAAHAKLQTEACHVLRIRNLAYMYNSAEGKAALLATGCAEAVVGALRAHPSVAAVQEHGCGAVCNLAFTDEGIAAVLAVGGAEAVVGALRAHLSVAAVQKEGCMAMVNLACTDEGKATLLAVGGAEAVVGALRAHPSVAAVQLEGCWAAAHLAEIAEGTTALKRAGAEQLAREASRNHPTDAHVQKQSKRVLTRLSE
jgi:hypothetical protein